MKIKKIKFFLMYGQTESTARISAKSVGIDDEISIGEALLKEQKYSLGIKNMKI